MAEGDLSGAWILREGLDIIGEVVTGHETSPELRTGSSVPGLAGSLRHQVERLRILRLREEALDDIDAEIPIRHALAQPRRETSFPEFAGMLSNLASCLSGLGRHDEALAAVNEAVNGYRTLAEIRPTAAADGYANTHHQGSATAPARQYRRQLLGCLYRVRGRQHTPRIDPRDEAIHQRRKRITVGIPAHRHPVDPPSELPQ